ncbi:MAG TPA: iron ABC transporter permease [Holophagaceae bacterium]|nr:iron ABC transporter permease [Holophagaceae bacterium]
MRRGAWLLLTALLLGLLVASLAVGELRLSLAQIWAGLRGTDELAHTVIWNLRLPRALVAVAVGAGLAASGVVMQALFRNPLASPDLLGVSSGGALGAVIALSFGFGAENLVAVPLCALAGAFLAVALVLMLARQGAGMERLLLSGVALATLLGAGTSFVLSLHADQFRRSIAMVFWMLGGLEDRTWEHVAMAVPGVFLGCLLLLPLGRPMDLLALGEGGAQSLGVDVKRLRWKLIALSTLLTALATAVAGLIGFVGLVVPHLLRLLVGPGHRRLLPLSMLGGASFLLACDLATRFAPGELRVGVVSAVVGGPFFLWLLRRRP